VIERVGAAEAADVLAPAFADDPVLTHLVRPSEVRLVLGALSHEGFAEGIRVDGRLVAVAVWLAPGAPHGSLVRQLPSWARLATRNPRAVPRLLRAGRTLDALHPAEPHWFLSLLGVLPELQGTGLGSALVRPGLERAAGQLVHLDTARPENVPWYRRFGFEVTGEVRAVPGAPPSWGMQHGG
jgi:ribosomal protein S18 acetylase RimI-like enzyme